MPINIITKAVKPAPFAPNNLRLLPKGHQLKNLLLLQKDYIYFIEHFGSYHLKFVSLILECPHNSTFYFPGWYYFHFRKPLYQRKMWIHLILYKDKQNIVL